MTVFTGIITKQKGVLLSEDALARHLSPMKEVIMAYNCVFLNVRPAPASFPVPCPALHKQNH